MRKMLIATALMLMPLAPPASAKIITSDQLSAECKMRMAYWHLNAHIDLAGTIDATLSNPTKEPRAVLVGTKNKQYLLLTTIPPGGTHQMKVHNLTQFAWGKRDNGKYTCTKFFSFSAKRNTAFAE